MKGYCFSTTVPLSLLNLITIDLPLQNQTILLIITATKIIIFIDF
jgi:hypothetical protein